MEELTVFGRLLGTIAGAAIAIVFFFVCIANYILDRKAIRLVEIAIFVLLGFDFAIRTFGAMEPPRVSIEFLTISTIILRILLVIGVIVWGSIMAHGKWKQIRAREIAINASLQDEREHESHV